MEFVNAVRTIGFGLVVGTVGAALGAGLLWRWIWREGNAAALAKSIELAPAWTDPWSVDVDDIVDAFDRRTP